MLRVKSREGEGGGYFIRVPRSNWLLLSVGKEDNTPSEI